MGGRGLTEDGSRRSGGDGSVRERRSPRACRFRSECRRPGTRPGVTVRPCRVGTAPGCNEAPGASHGTRGVTRHPGRDTAPTPWPFTPLRRVGTAPRRRCRCRTFGLATGRSHRITRQRAQDPEAWAFTGTATSGKRGKQPTHTCHRPTSITDNTSHSLSSTISRFSAGRSTSAWYPTTTVPWLRRRAVRHGDDMAKLGQPAQLPVGHGGPPGEVGIRTSRVAAVQTLEKGVTLRRRRGQDSTISARRER
jgi:hypothetical protein